MRIIFIGAGKLATNLALAICRNTSHKIKQVFSNTIQSAEELAKKINDIQCSETQTDKVSAIATNNIDDIEEADLFIISIKDSALQNVVSRLCNGTRTGLFVHTAGSIPMNIFEGHTARFGVFYPMQTFSKQKIADFSKISTFVEANNDSDLQLLLSLGKEICGNTYELSSEARKRLHLAAVFACNFANHCFALSAEILEEQGVPFNVMLPLIDETTLKVHSLHPRDAQTGPAVRFDKNVIEMQSRMLAHKPTARQIYDLMSSSIHETATTHNDNSK
jgi:predicted short-subunit dehydrogenase-like oxidoreductase (DUF2520 family)